MGPDMPRLPRFLLGRLDSGATLLVALGLVAVLAWMQYSQETLVTGDSYFHARAAQQLGEHGIERQFSQTVYSTWAERYSDKDFLFHVVLLPFCADPQFMVRGAKLAVVVSISRSCSFWFPRCGVTKCAPVGCGSCCWRVPIPGCGFISFKRGHTCSVSCC